MIRGIRSFFVIGILFLLANSCFAQKDSLSISDMKEDLNALKVVLTNLHPALKLNYANGDFLSNIDEIKIENNKSFYEFFNIVSDLISNINCGHTSVLPRRPQNIYYGNFPVELRYIEGVPVLKDDFILDSVTIPRGSIVKKINGISYDNIETQFLKIHRGIDNMNKEVNKEALGNNFAHNYALLFGMRDSFVVDLQNPNSFKDTTIIAKHPDSHTNNSDTLRLGINKRLSVGYLRIPTFATYPAFYNKKIDRYFRTIRKERIDHLIIDLRDNSGGRIDLMGNTLSFLINNRKRIITNVKTVLVNDDYSSYGFSNNPISQLSRLFNTNDTKTIKEEWQYVIPNENTYKGDIVVLMNGGSYSASAIFIAALKNFNKKVTIIGTESGASSIRAFAKQLNFTSLPHSKFIVSIPNSVIEYDYNAEFQASDKNLLPDIKVEQSMEDFLDEKDTQLRYAIEYITR